MKKFTGVCVALAVVLGICLSAEAKNNASRPQSQRGNVNQRQHLGGFPKHRSRDEFARLLWEEVADTIDQPTRSAIEEALIESDLLEYCRSALEKRNDQSTT